MNEMYRWQVTLGDMSCVVEAENKLWATKRAAQKLGVRWRETARDMIVLRMGRASV